MGPLLKLCVAFALVSISAGSAIMFREQDIQVKLRSSGSVSIATTEDPDDEETFNSVASLRFAHFKVKGHGAADDTVNAGDVFFDLDTSGYFDYGNRLVEGKSMSVNMSSIGVTLTVYVMVVKNDEMSDDMSGIKARDVMTSLELTPQRKGGAGCVVCGESGYSMELAMTVSQSKSYGESDVRRVIDGYDAEELLGSSTLYLPTEVTLNGEQRAGDIEMTSSIGTSHSRTLLFTFPSPLRTSIKAGVIVDVGDASQQNLNPDDSAMADEPNKNGGNSEEREPAAQDGGTSGDVKNGNNHNTFSVHLLVLSMSVIFGLLA